MYTCRHITQGQHQNNFIVTYIRPLNVKWGVMSDPRDHPVVALADSAEIGATSVNSGQPTSVPPRRASSGPKERTRHLLEERGVGDGSEGAPRVDSRT